MSETVHTPATALGSASGTISPASGAPQSGVLPATPPPPLVCPLGSMEPAGGPAPSDESLGRLTGLLSGLIEDQNVPIKPGSTGRTARDRGAQRFENRLAMVRLGMATSLFNALRCRHPPTATHSLRVAIGCSAWCMRLQMPEDERDRIEVAALLHDIGKIGIPDSILKKPGKLSVEEQMSMDLCPQLGVEILRGCTTDERLLDIVRFSRVWYEGRRADDLPHGEDLPIGARMLAIVEAFDAMTTNQIYRPAMSREWALAELGRCAGTQFDPALAQDYQRMLEANPESLHGGVAERWLNQLRESAANDHWRAGISVSASPAPITSPLDGFFRELMVHTYDGVTFVDTSGVIRAWNASLQQTTGIPADAICGNQWDPSIVDLVDARGQRLSREQCPVLRALAHGGPSNHQLTIRGRGDARLLVNLRVGSVSGPGTSVDGVVAIFQDASQTAVLEQRVQDLHERVTRDPLTGVANRAEFDRMLEYLTDQSREGNGSFSLIICDLDRFKQINDIHGHPAGDEAIVTFARIISEHSREADLVARYGGEEFVVLCPGCDNATAASRAEAVRVALEQTEFSFLDNQSITASFGVTEFQEGDAAETVLARADRALLRAKDNGRNRVIQLGSGGYNTRTHIPRPASRWLSWLDRGSAEAPSEFRLATPVPIDLVVEKLRGFVADHRAEILQVGRDEISIRVTAVFRVGGRRRTDHRVEFELNIQLDERDFGHGTSSRSPLTGRQTILDVNLRPVRGRDRRRLDVKEGATQVIASLRSYLMAESLPCGPSGK